MEMLAKKPLFNPDGDTDVRLRRMIGGNTTNLNDFNNMRYSWVSGWYRQAMNNFWIPEEISLAQDVKDYPRLDAAERTAYDKILSFLVFLDSIQTANLPNLGEYITANEVNLCLNIQTFQECVHSQSYSYMLDTICSPTQRDNILYQWKTDEHLLRRNTFIGECYNAFQREKSPEALLRALMANYILEGVYFYSGFMFFLQPQPQRQDARLRTRDPLYQPGREHPSVAVPQYHPGAAERTARAVRYGKRAHDARAAGGGRAAGDRVGPLCHRRRDPRPDAADGDGLYQVSGQSALDEPGLRHAV